jgi:hypothetical protein
LVIGDLSPPPGVELQMGFAQKGRLPICGVAAFRAESLWLSVSGIKS